MIPIIPFAIALLVSVILYVIYKEIKLKMEVK